MLLLKKKAFLIELPQLLRSLEIILIYRTVTGVLQLTYRLTV